ncbi:extracellular solute-binding protein [Bradyrhizobium sp. CB3481]|uniref:extracellular solute-binding protein n=1 Tax=Bradyrhizobium sp. CB3481 TaxID=3039158 RepID=UPI0024B17D67|nr:extracellular solute-binding protein [Bradyrhizobium sp. CB3481]WFU14868.1 extracellular solute-binding protein [Bradyrhizobium sp. CB3481]
MKNPIASWLVISSVFIAGLAVALSLTSLPTGAGNPKVLTVSFSNTNYKAFLEEAGRRFEHDHPGVSVIYMTPVATHREHLARTLRLAVAGEIQDISLQSYDQIAILMRRKLAIPLNDFIDSETDWNSLGLTAASMDACKLADKVYALPFESATPTLFFNKDLVRRAGGDPDHLPNDWDGILALAGKIHDLDDKIIGGFFDYNGSGNWTFQAMITSQGGRLMSEDDRAITFDGPEGRRALDIIRHFGQTGMVDMTQDQAFQAFTAGQIGIITQANTQLAPFEEEAKGRFEIQTMRWPLLSDRGRIPIGGRAMMMLTRDPQKQKIAWEYMKFLSNPQMQTLLAKMTGTTPVNMIAIREPAYLGEFYREHPNQRAAIEALPRVTGWYTFPGNNAARIFELLRNHLRDVAIRQTDVDKTLAAMSKDVRDLLP